MNAPQGWRALRIARSARERRLLAAGVAACALVIGYFLLWRPMLGDIARIEAELPRLRAQAEAVKLAADEISRLRAKAPPGTVDAAGLSGVVERTASLHGLKAKAIASQPDGARIDVTIERAPFDAWLAWIDELHRNHRIVVTAARIGALDAPGTIHAEAQLARAADLRR